MSLQFLTEVMESISVIFSDTDFLECSSSQDVCCTLVTSENAACVCEMPFISSFFSSSLLSSLWWKCDRIFRLHPVAQLPAPLSTQQRLRLAHFRPLGLRHFLGFHQVKELLSSLSNLSKQKMDRMKNVRVSLQAHLSICNETKQTNKQIFPQN